MNTDIVNFKKCGKLVYIKKPDFNELDYVNLSSDAKNLYCLVYNNENNPVGEVSFHRYDGKNKTAEFNIKIQNKYRHIGYGKEAIKLMLDYYFDEFGGEIMMDEVINTNGQHALLKFGFQVISKSEESIVFKMTKERYKQISF